MTDTVTILAEAFEDHQRGAAAPGTSLFEFMAKRLAAASPQGEGSSAEADTPQPDAPGWRDIATAPRDGDDLLVSDDETGARHVSYWTGECWSGPNGFKPTHWQPLPTAPSAHPAPIKPSGDTGELRERMKRAIWTQLPQEDANMGTSGRIADAILDLIQSGRAG